MLVTNTVTGKSFDAEPELDVVSSALRMSQPIGHSCRQGVCGSCSASILAGTYSLLGSPEVMTVEPGDTPQKVLLCRVMPLSGITLEHVPPTALERYAAQVFSLEAMTDDIIRLTLRVVSGNHLPLSQVNSSP
ncbi:2Fe-2S iron-sulfur cluster-binding protein [Pseudomonas sp. PhalM4]